VPSALPGQGKSRRGQRTGPLGPAGSKDGMVRLRDRLRAQRGSEKKLSANERRAYRKSRKGKGTGDMDISSAVASAQHKATNVISGERKNTRLASPRANKTIIRTVERADGTRGNVYKIDGKEKTFWFKPKKKRKGTMAGGRTSGAIPTS
jgi:hypothetical protein